MFASFKRSPASTSGNGNGSDPTGTEKDSSADYADLEKRADGRWSVQNRPGALQVAVHTHTETDGKATGRATCSGCPPAKVGVLSFTLFTLLISAVLVGVTGVNIAQNGERSWSAQVSDSGLIQISAGGSMRHVDFLVAATSLPLWAFLFVTCMLGLVHSCRCLFLHSPGLKMTQLYRFYATWRDRLKLFTAFWFVFLCHWVLDLASTITFLVVAYERDVIHPSNEVCSQHGLEPGCTVPVGPMLVLLTVALCLFKLITACEPFLTFRSFLKRT